VQGFTCAEDQVARLTRLPLHPSTQPEVHRWEGCAQLFAQVTEEAHLLGGEHEVSDLRW
jgi:hypothetical protein